MVQFNESGFTVTVNGGKSEYLETIETLLNVIIHPNDGESSSDERYILCNLIKNMLPSESQIVNEDEVKMLRRIKQDNIQVVSTVIESEAVS